MVIATIERRGFPEGINVLSKGNSPFFIPKSILIEFNLPFYEDDYEVDEYLFNQLKHINECYLCRKKGLDLLARREHSKYELTMKLKQRKFSSSAIDNTIEYLINKKFLSEQRFCESFINARLKKGEGRYLIFQKLQQKGISLSFSQSIYDEIVEMDDEINACIKSLVKIKNKFSDVEIIKNKLSKKGFSYQIIKEALEEKDS
jgi:regulatory protein